jgi:Family of unknown function (DUF6093)
VSVDALLTRGQRAAEALMVDRCVIRSVTGVTTDPLTGATTPTYATVYDDPVTPDAGGPCRFKMETVGVTAASDREAGEQPITVSRILLQLPAATTGVAKGQLVEAVTSRDTDLQGRTLRVDGPYVQTHATMRRYILEEAS